LALAAFEGVLLGLLEGHAAMQRAGARADGRVVVTGGGAKSPAYRQVLADLLGKAVHLLDAPEATARGACVQAAAVLHGRDVRAVREAWRPPVLAVCEPRAGAVRSIRRGYRALAELSETGRED
jgi:xylulokinase